MRRPERERQAIVAIDLPVETLGGLGETSEALAEEMHLAAALLG